MTTNNRAENLKTPLRARQSPSFQYYNDDQSERKIDQTVNYNINLVVNQYN